MKNRIEEVSDARNENLENAINADPYDVDAYSVLADWLQDQGDPRGELMALQIANKSEEATALIEKRADYFLGGLADHQKTYDEAASDAFVWKYGGIHAARLSHNHQANSIFKGSLAFVLDLLLRHPSGRFLTELTFGFNNDPSEDGLQNLVDIFAKQLRPAIRKLHFGDFRYAGACREHEQGEDTEISWYGVGNLANVWKVVPNLTTLITQGGSELTTVSGQPLKLGTLDLPKLAHAEFRTGGLERANAIAIATANIPSIEHLDIWYGMPGYGCDATVAEVQLLLDRTDLPKLRHLGLMNAMFTDELPELLAKSPLLKQLKELDLSLGCLTDAGAQVLAAHADAFEHLDTLDVSYCQLTEVGIAALEGCAKTIVWEVQRDEEDSENRYPAVGE